MTILQPSTAWLDAHRPVLEELHRVEASLRDHVRQVARLSREDPSSDPQLHAALAALGDDCELLGRVCTILRHCAPPPYATAAARFQLATERFCGASRAENVGALVSDFEVAVTELRGVEQELRDSRDAAGGDDQSGT